MASWDLVVLTDFKAHLGVSCDEIALGNVKGRKIRALPVRLPNWDDRRARLRVPAVFNSALLSNLSDKHSVTGAYTAVSVHPVI
jgi:hypothetical protein